MPASQPSHEENHAQVHARAFDRSRYSRPRSRRRRILAGAGACWGVATTAGGRNYVYLQYRRINALGHIGRFAIGDRSSPCLAAAGSSWALSIRCLTAAK